MLGDDIAAALPELRAQAESLMTETVQVTRRTGWGESGGRQIPQHSAVYTGCAGLGRSGVQPAEVGGPGQQLAAQQQIVKFPIGTYLPQDGDQVEFLTGSQAHLVGVRMRLIGAAPASSQSVQYRMLAERIV